MAGDHYYVGKVLGLSLAQPLSPKQFSMLTQLAVTDDIEVWSLSDQILYVSTGAPGVHTKPSNGTTQFLVKAADGDVFFTARYSYSTEENKRCLNQIIADSGEILATLIQLGPHTDFAVFRKEVFRIEAEMTEANRQADREAEIRTLAVKKQYIDDLSEQYLSGKMISAHDFALLLTEFGIWDSLSESMVAFILSTLFKVNRQGTHEIADESGSASLERTVLGLLASHLASQMREYPRPRPWPLGGSQKETT